MPVTFWFPEFSTWKYFQVMPSFPWARTCRRTWHGSVPSPFTTLSHKGEGSSCLRRFYNIWQKPMWQVKIFVRWLRKDISAREWGPPTRECGKYFSYSLEKGENVQASVSEWGVSSQAWVLFLYSMRNKTLRGFFIRARWCRIQSILPALSSSQPLCNKCLRTTWQMNKNYNLKAWEHLISASEWNIFRLVGHFAGSNHLLWFWNNI